jgi:hypothetical protein
MMRLNPVEATGRLDKGGMHPNPPPACHFLGDHLLILILILISIMKRRRDGSVALFVGNYWDFSGFREAFS